jgi:hypothetical protein
MKGLKDLMRLQRLKTIAEGSDGMHTNQLEQDFLEFSSLLPQKSLTVKLPSLYSVKGDEKQHLADILDVKVDANLPKAIDISGGFDYSDKENKVIFLSLRQLMSDHISSTRSYLNPLIENVYTSGETLIRDFGIHEGLVGTVTSKRGNLDLTEAHLFPEKFKTGAYDLSMVLDTPLGTVDKFLEITELLEQLKSNPKNALLNPSKISDLATKAMKLRKKLGSLSRYEVPDTKVFSASTNSCVIRTEDSTLFYLYSTKKAKNAVVYFGMNPFVDASPKELEVLNGNEHQKTLIELVDLGFYDASPSILERRIKNLNELYETAVRAGADSNNGNHLEFKTLLNNLDKSKNYFERVLNSDVRRQYVANLSPELAEFMVYPSTDDAIIHELQPRLSWNESLRNYHSTTKFISQFENADDQEKVDMLREVTSNILFNNQQNNNVNTWLYKNHHDFCEKADIDFTILK